MATHKGGSSINLLPKSSFEFSVAGKALKWAITVGRVLVVLTEFVVLLAFVSRFYFDKKLSDLGEELIQKEAQISAYAQVETDFRKVLAKQQPVEAFSKEGLGFSDKIDALSAVLPAGTVLDTFSIDKNGLTITGRATTEYAFAQFISGVKKMSGVSVVNMTGTSFDQSTGGVKFSIHITYK